jgi:hypothetical protein
MGVTKKKIKKITKNLTIIEIINISMHVQRAIAPQPNTRFF